MPHPRHPGIRPASTGGVAIRLGLGTALSLGDEVAQGIVAKRAEHGPFRDIGDLGHCVPLPRSATEALATGGAVSMLGTDRRRALWAAGAAAQTRSEHLLVWRVSRGCGLR